jgi:hypothetical protein
MHTVFFPDRQLMEPLSPEILSSTRILAGTKFVCRVLRVQETRLLQTIDRLKQAATEENKTARISYTLRTLCKPKQWELANGKTAKVHTPLTTRAWELMQLYNGLRLPLVSIEERLDVLLHVKWTVKEFDCNLTREIVDLVCLHFHRKRTLWSFPKRNGHRSWW